jgi:toxin-antitoxin system PIN domain toxin
MKLIDANVLIYVVNDDALEHKRVLTWWELAIQREEPLGLPWIVLLSFVRISTHPHIFPHPLTLQEASAKLDTWLALPNIKAVAETEDHWRILKQLLSQISASGNLVNDAHLAALAIAWGATIVSCDQDFHLFRQVRWENPLAPASR